MQKFFRITLPGLSPIMFYTLVVNTALVLINLSIEDYNLLNGC